MFSFFRKIPVLQYREERILIKECGRSLFFFFFFEQETAPYNRWKNILEQSRRGNWEKNCLLYHAKRE